MKAKTNCDMCWDEDHSDVPAFEEYAGVPLCALHIAKIREENKTKMKRHQDDSEPEPVVGTPVLDSIGRKKVRKSATVASKGIRTAKDFAELMTALMDDLLSNSVDMGTAMAVCNAGDRLLRVAEMQIRYQPRNGKELLLGAPQVGGDARVPTFSLNGGNGKNEHDYLLDKFWSTCYRFLVVNQTRLISG